MRKLILGIDWCADCDDVVAVRLLARMHKAGKIQLAGIGINQCVPFSVASLDAFLQNEGVTDMPLGIDLDATDYVGKPEYQARMAQLPSRYTANEEVGSAVSLYRRILAESDEPLEIVEIGFLQVAANTLMSGPDEISPKTGMELFREKVKKMWIMAGKWDEEGGKEYNFCRTERTRIASNVICRLCPVPITFLGWEIGCDVITGGLAPDDDVMRIALMDHGSGSGRMSWDPMTAMLAVIGNEKEAGYDTVRGTASVDVTDGANHFEESVDGPHLYVKKVRENEFYQKMINDIVS